MDTDLLLRDVLLGDRQAYGRLVQRYQDGVFAFLWRMGLRRAVIDELAQETFLRAWTHLSDYQPGRAAFSTWLFAISRHLALNELGRAGHRIERGMDALPGVDPAADDADGPPARLERLRDRERLHAALRRLAPPQRTVLALSYLRELSLAEVAVIEGITLGAAKLRLHRARLALRLELEKLP